MGGLLTTHVMCESFYDSWSTRKNTKNNVKVEQHKTVAHVIFMSVIRSMLQNECMLMSEEHMYEGWCYTISWIIVERLRSIIHWKSTSISSV